MSVLQQEESLFEAARNLQPPAQRVFLEAACAGDGELLERVASLLKAGAQSEEFFKAAVKSAGDLARDISHEASNRTASETTSKTGGLTIDEASGRIGNYKLLQKIGEGGCGVVYMAEQEKPLRRRVALKIIKLGMDTKNVIARFEAERQALAIMDHPNIARVLDAGATETGRPYFVMELVRGIKITDYCDQNHLDTRGRLNLFIQVCQAIQHAHQKGIIHRDIKPSNVLITLHDGVPVPKVIDFGIAKAIEARLTDKTLFTAYEQMVGTPAYMSPEQAEMSGLDIDTRSDIYSLGVLLYELLTGRPPFDPKKLVQGGLDEMRRTLREREPQRPSTMVTTLQHDEMTAVTLQRGVELPRLISTLRGDLDWIVMKALEKDRKRRYETANGLAMDIERYLVNEPVIARPPSRLYRFQKLVRRNKVVFAAGAAVMLVLMAGMGTSTWLFFKERDAKQRAVEAEHKESVLRQQAELGEKVSQLTLLTSEEKYDEADVLLGKTVFTEPSLDAAAVLRTLGEWHARRGDWRAAADRFGQLLQVDEFDGWDVMTLDYLECGPTFIELNDEKGYERFRGAAIARFANTTYPVGDRIAKICLLVPADGMVMKALEPTATNTLQTFESTDNGQPPDHFRAAWQCISLALLEYRRGNYTNTVNWAKRCLSYQEYNAPRTATAQVILAMAHWQLHDPEAARANLAPAHDAIDEQFKTELDRGSANNGFWFDWVFARILLREATALTGGEAELQK